MAVMAYASAARLLHEDRTTLFDNDWEWPRSSLVEDEPAEEPGGDDVDLEQVAAAYALALNAGVQPKPEAPGNRPDRPQAEEGGGKQRKSTGTQHKLVQQVLEQCLEATPEQKERMKQVPAQIRGAPVDVRAAAAADGNVLEALFDNEAELTVDLLISVQTALKAPPEDKPKGKKGEKGGDKFPAKVTTVVPKRVKIADVNAAILAAHGQKFTPIPESSKKDGAVIKCGRQLVDELKKGFKVQGHHIKPQGKAQDEDSSEEEAESEEKEVIPTKVKGSNKASKVALEGSKKEATKKGVQLKWGFACFGCGGKHKWGECDVTFPACKETCDRCVEKGHMKRMCKLSSGAREEFNAKYGTPMKWLSKRLAVAAEDSSSSEDSSEEDDSESGDDWIKPAKGSKQKSEKETKSKRKKSEKGKKLKQKSKEEKGKKEKKKGKKETKEADSKRKSKKGKKTQDESSSSEEDTSSEDKEPRSKKNSKKEIKDKSVSQTTPSEKLLRLQWKTRMDKMSASPATPQGSQRFSLYSARSLAPY